MLRIPEPMAFDHGFTVDEDALKSPSSASTTTIDSRSTGSRTGDDRSTHSQLTYTDNDTTDTGARDQTEPPPDQQQPQSAPLEDIEPWVQTLTNEHGPVVISFPITKTGNHGINTLDLINNLSNIPPTDVSVTARIRANGRIMTSDREIPLPMFANILKKKSDGKRIILTMPGAMGIVEPLQALMDQDVVARPPHMTVDLGTIDRLTPADLAPEQPTADTDTTNSQLTYTDDDTHTRSTETDSRTNDSRFTNSQITHINSDTTDTRSTYTDTGSTDTETGTADTPFTDTDTRSTYDSRSTNTRTRSADTIDTHTTSNTRSTYTDNDSPTTHSHPTYTPDSGTTNSGSTYTPDSSSTHTSDSRTTETGTTDTRTTTDAVISVPYSANAIRNTLPTALPAVQKPPPHYVVTGRGIGSGLVMTEQDTVDQLLAAVIPELREHGFLPVEGDPMQAQKPHHHGESLNSQLVNESELRKLISLRGIDSHYDQIHQDGLTFTLRHRQGAAGVTFDVDHAKITLKAVRRHGSPIDYLGETDQYAAVNLGMGMAVAGMSTGGGRRATFAVKAAALAKVLKTGGMGIGYSKSISANNNVTHLNNRPELLEFAGKLDVFEVSSDYVLTVEYQHSGRQGKVLPGRRNPEPIRLPDQKSRLMLVPLAHETPPEYELTTLPPKSVLDHAVISYLDTKGIRPRLRRMLTSLTGPAGFADQEINTFSGTIVLRAFFKEIINGEFTTDAFFESGWFRDKHAAANIEGTLGWTRFVGATESDFVLGIIKLALTIAGESSTRSSGLTWEQLDLLLGEAAPDGPTASGGFGASRSWQKNRTTAMSRTGGKELLQLNFNRAYVYESDVDITTTVKEERRGKIGSTQRAPLDSTRPKKMRFMLPEPEALDWYARGHLPIADDQLIDAMERWANEKLRISGNLAAGVLSRWATPHPDVPPANLDRVRGWADMLVLRHAAAGDMDIVTDPVRVTEFNNTFGVNLADVPSPFADLILPEYLNQPRTQKNLLGHSGVHEVYYRDPAVTNRNRETSLFEVTKRLVDQVAPTLLTSNTNMWDAQGKQIGTEQTGVRLLQTVAGRGRDHPLWDDFLSPNGVTLYLGDQVNWLSSDVVEITFVATLTSPPRFKDKRTKAGTENYDHNYDTTSTGWSKDVTQTLSGPKLNVSDGVGSWSGNGRIGQGRHVGTTHTTQRIAEQTAYDHDGYYIVQFDHQMVIKVRRLDMNGRPVNNFLLHSRPNATPRPSDPANGATATVTGTLDLQVPRSIAESKPQVGPNKRNFKPMAALPGDAIVVGTLLDDTVPIAFSMLRNIFGNETSGIIKHSSLNLPMLLSRLHLNNHLPEAISGKRYVVGENLILPGHSSDRLTISLAGDLYDAEVLHEFYGAGTGRYSKSLESTTVNASSDHWRATGEMSGSATVAPNPREPNPESDNQPRPDDTVTPSQAMSRSVPAGSAATDNQNLRREQHAKQKAEAPKPPDPKAPEDTAETTAEDGPNTMETVVLARFRGRFRLVAEYRRHHLFREKPTLNGRFESEPITGDVYTHIFRSQFNVMRDEPSTTTGHDVDRAYLNAAEQHGGVEIATDPAPRRRRPPDRIGRITEVWGARDSTVHTMAKPLAQAVLQMHRDGVRPTIVIYGHYSRESAAKVGLELAGRLRSELVSQQRPAIVDGVTARLRGRQPATAPAKPMTLSDIDVRLRGRPGPFQGVTRDRISVMLTVQSRDGESAGVWAQLGLTRPIDLVQLLDAAAQNGENPFRVHEYLAKEIRAEVGGDLAVTLNLNLTALKRAMLPPVLSWAARTIRDDIAAATARNDNTVVVTPNLLGVLDNLIANPDQLDPFDAHAFLDEVLRTVNQTRDDTRLPDTSHVMPVAMPPHARLLISVVGPVAQEIAFELDAPIRVNEIHPNGSIDRWEATPSGRLDHHYLPPPRRRRPAPAPQPDATRDTAAETGPAPEEETPQPLPPRQPTPPRPEDETPPPQAEQEPIPSTSKLEPPPTRDPSPQTEPDPEHETPQPPLPRQPTPPLPPTPPKPQPEHKTPPNEPQQEPTPSSSKPEPSPTRDPSPQPESEHDAPSPPARQPSPPTEPQPSPRTEPQPTPSSPKTEPPPTRHPSPQTEPSPKHETPQPTPLRPEHETPPNETEQEPTSSSSKPKPPSTRDPSPQPEPDPVHDAPPPPPEPGPLPAAQQPLVDLLASRAATSEQAARLRVLAAQPGPPAEPARLVQAFEELELRNVVANLNTPAADQVLLDLVRMIANDEATTEGVTAAVGLFHQYGLLEVVFGQPGWPDALVLSRLHETIDHLDDNDPDNTSAAEFVWYLATHSA